MKKFVVSTTTPYDIIIGKDLIKDAGVYIHTCIPPLQGLRHHRQYSQQYLRTGTFDLTDGARISDFQNRVSFRRTFQKPEHIF